MQEGEKKEIKYINKSKGLFISPELTLYRTKQFTSDHERGKGNFL